MPTLVDYRQSEETRRTDEVAKWQADLSAAQSEIVEPPSGGPDTLQSTARKATDAVAALDAEIRGLRDELASATSPVALDALAATIAAKTKARRVAAWQAIEASAALDAQKARVADLQSRVMAATAALTEAKAAHAAAKEQADAVDTLKARLTGELAGLPAAAAGELAGATFGAADARFGPAVLPAELRALADKRVERWRKVAEAAQQRLVDVQDVLRGRQAGDGTAAAAAAARVAHARAGAALAHLARTGQERLDHATTIVASVEAQAVIDAAVTTRLNQGIAARQAAQATALAYEQARLDEIDPQLARDKAAAAFVAADPLASEATIDADATVAPLAAALQAAKDATGVAAGAYSPADRETILSWQAEVPEAAWSSLLDLLDAKLTLEGLQGTNIAAVIAAYDAAESAYATALLALADEQRAGQHLEAEAARLGAVAESRTAEARARRLAAVAGTGE